MNWKQYRKAIPPLLLLGVTLAAAHGLIDINAGEEERIVAQVLAVLNLLGVYQLRNEA